MGGPYITIMRVLWTVSVSCQFATYNHRVQSNQEKNSLKMKVVFFFLLFALANSTLWTDILKSGGFVGDYVEEKSYREGKICINIE